MVSNYDVYEFLVEYFEKNGYAPTYKEIADGVGLSSKASVIEKLQSLEVLGKIVVKPKSPRAIKLVGYTLVKEEIGKDGKNYV